MYVLNKLQIIFLVFLVFLPIFTNAQDSGNPNPLIELPRIPNIDLPSRPTPKPLTGEKITPAPDIGSTQGKSGSRTILPLKPTSGRTQTIDLPNPLKATSFAELINRITNWLLVIGAPILVLMIIIGAFQIMTGAGNPENITKGRHTITYAIIGYALLLISSGITLIIEQLLGVKK